MELREERDTSKCTFVITELSPCLFTCRQHWLYRVLYPDRWTSFLWSDALVYVIECRIQSATGAVLPI